MTIEVRATIPTVATIGAWPAILSLWAISAPTASAAPLTTSTTPAAIAIGTIAAILPRAIIRAIPLAPRFH